MDKIKLIIGSFSEITVNLSKTLKIAWTESKFVVLGYFGTAALGAIFPVVTSFIYKLMVDQLIAGQRIEATIPLILVSILGSLYIVEVASDFLINGLKSTYLDYLLRYKMQNALTLIFLDKVSNLDLDHYENPKTQDLLTKARDTFTWRVPDYLRQSSYLFTNIVSYLTVVILLIPYGVIMPLVLTLLSIPRLYLRTKFSRLNWGIYDSSIPEVRKLWVYRWLLTNKNAVTETRIFQTGAKLLKMVKDIQDSVYLKNKDPLDKFLPVAIYPKLFEIAAVFVFAYIKLPNVLNGSLSVGDYTFFIGLLARLTNSAAGLVLNFGDMYDNNLYVNHFFEVMDLPRKIIDSKKPVPIVGVNPPKIEFKNVSFSYPRSENLVLDNISFTINSQENVAIVGKNGAGKTTIIKLLCRFYDVNEGEILINGINLKDIKITEWYEQLGTLFQEFVHYDFTVTENIALGSSEKTNSQKVRNAAVASGADGFIQELPNKYDQLLGREFEGGVELSQGQWQKLAIARAFYENAPVLILDEPTSAIDAEAEYEIFNNLHDHYEDKTLVFISHRFSTVRNADKIIVVDSGKIVEEGTHKELLEAKGIYKKMFDKQALGYK